jgi:dihydroorotate dehydrogenase electron transfer subunit
MPKRDSFVLHRDRPRPLLIGEGVGVPRILSFAETFIERPDTAFQPLVLLGSDEPFPFRPRPSTIMVPGIPAGTIACVPKLEEFGIASRLASRTGYPGCFDGDVAELATLWLSSLDASALEKIEMFACGSQALSAAARAIAQRFGVPIQ